jgi:hypothetical protein
MTGKFLSLVLCAVVFLAIGVTTLEMDMQITADGVIVIHHNKAIPWYMAKNAWGRFLTADEQPDIRFWRLEDLRKFDIGAMSPDAPYGYWDGHGKTQKQAPGAYIGPDGTLYVGVLGRIVVMRDGNTNP